MPRRSKWTEEEWESLAKQVKEYYVLPDETHRTIAIRLKCSEQTVRNILYGFKPRYFKLPKTVNMKGGKWND